MVENLHGQKRNLSPLGKSLGDPFRSLAVTTVEVSDRETSRTSSSQESDSIVCNAGHADDKATFSGGTTAANRLWEPSEAPRVSLEVPKSNASNAGHV